MRSTPRISIGLLLAAVVACTTGRPTKRPANSRPTITTEAGAVVGAWRDGVRVFLGIPYAQAPTGALRWQPPRPAAPWTSPRDATRRGDACPQIDDGIRPAQSEDCLNLNVWAPADTDQPLPVMVWIHGGAFHEGSGSDDLYDGAGLATRARAIVVTINYRLGPLGFLAHRDLAREAGRATSPSYGLLDQRAALAWVQRNIRAFGGDPERVTIFGNSAGAWSVCAHLASPGSRGLFARAIMQSGACSDALYFGRAEAEAQGEALARAVQCDGPSPLACLRATPAETLARALPMKRGSILHPGVWWGPVVDGIELPRLPLETLRAGEGAPVPLLIGANRDEGILHTVSFDAISAEEIDDFVTSSFGSGATSAVAARYPHASRKEALNDVITDGVFVCQARRVARVLATQGVPAYLYHFTRALDDPRVHQLGATHSVELFFLWGNTASGLGLSDRERALSRLMMDAWGAFARDGDPSTQALPWPRYTVERDEHAVLDLPAGVGANLKRDVCDFWDEIERRQ